MAHAADVFVYMAPRGGYIHLMSVEALFCGGSHLAQDYDEE